MLQAACVLAALALGAKPDQAPPINPRFSTRMSPASCDCTDCRCLDCDGKCSLGKPVKINPSGVDPVRGYKRRVQQTGSELVRVCDGGQCRWVMRPTYREVRIAR